MNILISTQKPRIYEMIKSRFPEVEWDDGIAITYGNTVYAKYPLAPDVASHEEIHAYQQEGIDPDEWWKKYLTNTQFRLSQEAEAYKFQAKFIRQVIKDRNTAFKLIHRLAIDLSSPMYGNMCTYSEAMSLIK